jgi:hypothetical protein
MHEGAHSSSPRAAIIADYDVRYDAPSGTLSVEARIAPHGGTRYAVDRGVEGFVRDLEAAPLEGDSWTKASRVQQAFAIAQCASGCRLRYRLALREACKDIDDIDVASEEGEVLEAPPSTWLVAPLEADAASRVRFRVSTSAGTRFVTGTFPSREAKDAWDITLDDLWTSPYTAFGPLRVVQVEATNATIDLAIAPGKMAVTDDDLVRWTKDSARAVSLYFERFPMPTALVLVVPGRGRWIGVGRALAGGGGTVFVRVGANASKTALAQDWVLPHEMIHLMMPSQPRERDWAEEGLATYVEPFARVRAGLVTPEEAWKGLVEGFPHGLPRKGDQGLDRTPTWGRLYWGGALFYLLADVEIRKRTNNTKGLEHALRGVLAAGGTNAVRWSLEDVFQKADTATGTTVLRDLHDLHGAKPSPMDLEGTLKALGVSLSGGTIKFDDKAPLANIRKAITHGS